MEQGLSQNSVYTLTQDQRGFIWIGTQDGLNKYDGYKFTAYRHSSNYANAVGTNGLKGTIPNAWIERIVRDRYNNLWVSSNGGGIAHIHRDSAHAVLLPTLTDAVATGRQKNTHALRSSFTTALWADKFDHLWIGTDKGLHCIERIKPSYSEIIGTKRTIRHANVDIRFVAETVSGVEMQHFFSEDIKAIIGDNKGNVWVATAHALYCIKAENYKPSLTTNDHLVQIIPLQGLSPNTTIQSLYADSLGRIWVGTLGQGVLLYNPQTNQTRIFPLSASPKSPIHRLNAIAGSNVYCFASDSRGYLWVGTDQGISILSRNVHSMADSANIPITVCRANPQISTSVSDNIVRSLLCDNSGTMWVGTLTGGLSVWNPLRQRFGRYSPNAGNAPFLPYRVVRSFYEETDSVLWIGTDDGLVRWNHQTGSFTQIPVQSRSDAFENSLFNTSSLRAVQSSSALASARIWAIHREKSGIFWFATDGGGLHRYDHQARKFTIYQHNPDDSTSICHNRVRSITPDHEGNLWLGTMNGLEYFNTKTRVFTHFRHNPLDSNSLSNDRVQWIMCDGDSTVWVATTLGLNKFFPKQRLWKRYFHDSTAKSVANSWVKHIMRDKAGTMWLTTVRGLCRYDDATDSFARYGTENGLTNEYIYGIVEDTQGFLWMGTDGGLARFDKQNAVFRMFELADGLQSNEFNTNAFYRTSSGMLLFGGVNGMNMFNPKDLQEREFMPDIVLSSVKIFNQEQYFDVDVCALQTLTLSHLDRLIQLDFAALDFANIERVKYAYMLEGIEREFVSFGTRHFAMYTNIPPGEYTFRVRATNADGVWNARELSLRVVVIPPFWETWWFRSLLVIVFIGCVWGGVQWRLSRIAHRNSLLREEVRKRTQQIEQSNQELAWSNERLHELNSEKNAILGIAAHDLKTPLSTMLTLTELIENDKQMLSSEELYHFNSLMRQSATRMMSLIKQLLDMNMIDEGKLNLNAENVLVNDIVGAMVADAEALAHPKNLKFHFVKPQERYYIYADQNAYMQIIDNLLSNAVKYSPLSKNVWIELKTLEREFGEYVCFSVRDEGMGLTDDDKKRLFGKFARLSARPTGGEHSTGLGLSIVKKLVEAMDGEIWCESEYRKGALFAVAFKRVRID